MRANLSKRVDRLEKAQPEEQTTIRVIWDDESAEPGEIVIEWDENEQPDKAS